MNDVIIEEGPQENSEVTIDEYFNNTYTLSGNLEEGDIDLRDAEDLDAFKKTVSSRMKKIFHEFGITLNGGGYLLRRLYLKTDEHEGATGYSPLSKLGGFPKQMRNLMIRVWRDGEFGIIEYSAIFEVKQIDKLSILKVQINKDGKVEKKNVSIRDANTAETLLIKVRMHQAHMREYIAMVNAMSGGLIIEES